MQTTLDKVLTVDSELEKYYREILNKFNLDKMDATVREFEKEVRDNEGQLPNERVRYYISMFAYYSYALNATLSRHAMRSDVAEFYYEHMTAVAFTKTPPEGQKLTREDKQALAKLETEQEAKAQILYTRVTQAVETRIKALNKFIETLNMLGAMNMSEAKLGGRQ